MIRKIQRTRHFLSRIFYVLCALLAVGMSVNARADIYGFVDSEGVIHFSSNRDDQRYQLYFREGDAAQSPGISGVARARGFGQADPQFNLKETVLFKRVSVSPNVPRYAALIRGAAKENGLDEHLIKSVIAVESAFDPAAVSNKGAVGLMQVIPETAMRYGLRPTVLHTVEQQLAQPEINVRVGARYLADLCKMFAGDLHLVLAAYNAGENAVKRSNNQIPPFPETQGYVRMVEQFYAYYAPGAVARNALDGDDEQRVASVAHQIHVSFAARRNMPGQGGMTLLRNQPPTAPMP